MLFRQRVLRHDRLSIGIQMRFFPKIAMYRLKERLHMITRRAFLKNNVLSLTALAGNAARPALAQKAPGGPNVLFICVDDLRPQLGCYGNDFMHTPHMDRLASEGVLFRNHFVQVPTCGASRCSLWTGLRPHKNALLNNTAFNTLPRHPQKQAVSLPELFHRNGYSTVSLGKVTHQPNGLRHGKPTNEKDAKGNMRLAGINDLQPELANAWDRVQGPIGEWGSPWNAFFGYAGGKTRPYDGTKSPLGEAADVPDTGYPDGHIAESAIQELQRLKDQPFFLSVGFYKPHLPFCAPKKYWDLYDPDALPLAPHPDAPEGVNPSLSLHSNGEMTGRYAAMKDPLQATEAEARHARHGYFACVSYVDAQVGKVLDEVDRLGLRENTIIVLWGDHGWHLGDLNLWGKHTTFEYALRSTLLMRVPGAKQHGAKMDGLVESVDLYPTLADYCRLQDQPPVDGLSLRPLLNTPNHPGKDSALSYWKRGTHTAKTMRTTQYRLVVWRDKAGKTVQIELYDHQDDPGETVNVARKHPDAVAMLTKQMDGQRPQWKT
jgi:iduronate 2-sulfatase